MVLDNILKVWFLWSQSSIFQTGKDTDLMKMYAEEQLK